LLFAILQCGKSFAQPGWADFSEHYQYNILDRDNHVIHFRTDSSYIICINGEIFKGSSIPSDTFVRPVCCKNQFNQHIQLNDFSRVIPLKETPPGIAIIHGNDTMHLSAYDDLALQFDSGCFYFPYWASNILGRNKIKTSGTISIVNQQQSLFRITKMQYAEYLNSNYKWSKISTDLADTVTLNFIRQFITVSAAESGIKFINKMKVYKTSYVDGDMFKTPDSNVYACMLVYTLDTNSTYISMPVFSLFDKKKNTIIHWMPSNDPQLFYESDLRFDKYEAQFYLTVGIRKKAKDPYNGISYYDPPFTTNIYSSKDYGLHWQVEPEMSRLFKKYDIRKTEFLDGNNKLLYRLTKRNNGVQKETAQGTYFLLHNNMITDSLKSPNSIYYDDLYNQYYFSRRNDTVAILGAWSRIPENINLPFYLPQVIKKSGHWKFKVIKDSVKYGANTEIPVPEVKSYRNFTLLNNNLLLMRDNKDSLLLKNEKIEHILEKGDQIYIIQRDYVLLSFDGGKNWVYYPKALGIRDSHSFLNIDAPYNISFYDMTRFKKIEYRFKINKK